MTNIKTVGWETIDQSKAVGYLSEMRNNRRVSQASLDYFSNVLRNGQWRETHQGIAFDRNDVLVDGQTRLWAVIETGIPIRVMVTRGLEADEVLAMDQGRFRDAADNAHYAGVDVDKFTWAIINMMVNGSKAATTRVPFHVKFAWYEFYKGAVDFAVEATATCRPGTRHLLAPTVAAIARAYYAVPREQLLRFIEVLKDGQKKYEADSAAVLLRDNIIGHTMVTRTEIYFKSLAAIRAFAERRPIKKLQAAESDIWAIPALPRELRYKLTNGSGSPRSGAAARKRFLTTLA